MKVATSQHTAFPRTCLLAVALVGCTSASASFVAGARNCTGPDDAIAAVQGFATKAGLAIAAGGLEAEAVEDTWRDWVVSNDQLTFDLRIIGGTPRVVGFTNDPLVRERERSAGSRQSAIPLGPSESRERARALARDLVPEWNLLEVAFYYAAEPNQSVWLTASGHDRCGGARVEFGHMEPEGLVFPTERALRIVIDTLDGALLSFHWTPGEYEITSRAKVVTEQEARAKATATALAVHGVDTGAHDIVVAQGYAGVTQLPGVERRTRTTAPFEIRLAWRVKALSVLNGNIMQDLFVDIDAQTGEVLNTGWMKPERPPGG